MVDTGALYEAMSSLFEEQPTISFNKVQNHFKGTDLAFRREVGSVVWKEVTTYPVLENLDNDSLMKVENVGRLKEEVREYAKRGRYDKIADLNDTLFSKDGQPIHESTE